MRRNYHNLAPTYYEATALDRTSFATLKGSTETDVCVIGGGIAGCSAALELAGRGFRVVLLEAETIGSGASGRSGGQIIPGYAAEQATLERLLSRDNAKRLWDVSVEAIRLLRDRIARHAISCDWRAGQVQVALKPRQRELLLRWRDELEQRYDYRSTRFLERDAVRALIASERYCAGLYDDNAGHLHPLNYTLGLARAAQNAGAVLHEHSRALSVDFGSQVNIKTSTGTVAASFALLCGNAHLGSLAPSLADRIMPVETYMIATEPLGEERARALIRDGSAVMDANFILDYFRLSADHRLLFGGRVSYSGRDLFDSTQALRKRLVRVFPQLADVKIDFTWSGRLDITMNRAPDFGRLAPNLYYLQGFSGHGLALAGMAAKLAADAIAGHAERFDLFAKIAHRNFPGGKLFRTPALVLAMLWYRLRDLL